MIGSYLPRDRGKEFIRFLKQLEREVPSELDVHLILDNYSTHKSAAVQLVQAPKAPPFPLPFHTDEQFLAQSGRALVWTDH